MARKPASARPVSAKRPDPLGEMAPTAEDLAVDLAAAIRLDYAHVPLTAPVSCGRSYLAAVRRALWAEAEVERLRGAFRDLVGQAASERVS